MMSILRLSDKCQPNHVFITIPMYILNKEYLRKLNLKHSLEKLDKTSIIETKLSRYIKNYLNLDIPEDQISANPNLEFIKDETTHS